MKSTFREHLLTLVLLIGTLVVTFFPIIFEGRSLLPSDLIDTMTLPFSQYFGPQHAYNSYITDAYFQFYPLKYFTSKAYHHGYFAFWNPYVLNGYPQYLEGMWTYNFLLFLPFELAFVLLLTIPLLVAGFGFYLLLRDYQVRPSIARLFAIAYMLNSLFVTHLLAYFIPASFSFAPFVLLFLHRYNRTSRRKYLIFSSISLSLGFMAGNAQTIAFICIMVAIYWAMLVHVNRESQVRLWKPMIVLFSITIGLSMILLLPTTEFFYEVLHGGLLYSTSLNRSYGVLQRVLSALLTGTFFFPQLAGSIRGLMLHQIVGVYTIDFQGSIGFLPLLFAVWGAFHLWRSTPSIRPFVVLMVAGLLIPIATPLFRFLYHRFFIVFVLGACGSGALAMEQLLSSDSTHKSAAIWLRRTSIVLFAAVVLMGIGSVILLWKYDSISSYAAGIVLPRLDSVAFASGNEPWVQSRLREAMDYWCITRPEIVFGFASCIAVVLVVRWYLKRPSNRAMLVVHLVGAITLFQLVYFARSWFPMTDLGRYPLYPKTTLTSTIQQMQRDRLAYFYRSIIPGKQYMFINNENVMYGIHEPTGFESVVPRCLYNILGRLSTMDSIHPSTLAKFNIGMLVSERPLAADSNVSLVSHDSLWLYNIRQQAQRAFLSHSAIQVQTDSEVILRLSDQHEVWPAAFFSPDVHAKTFRQPSDSNDRVEIIESDGNRMTCNTNSSTQSYLVITDTYYPGWTCTVDGKTTPVLRCNYCMRAIELPAGSHKVNLSFRPTTFDIGRWISLFTLAVSILFIVVDNQKHKAQTH